MAVKKKKKAGAYSKAKAVRTSKTQQKASRRRSLQKV